MSEAKILGFPIEGSAKGVIIREGEPGYIGGPTPECLAEIEEMERQNRQNAADFMRRNVILDVFD